MGRMKRAALRGVTHSRCVLFCVCVYDCVYDCVCVFCACMPVFACMSVCFTMFIVACTRACVYTRVCVYFCVHKHAHANATHPLALFDDTLLVSDHTSHINIRRVVHVDAAMQR